jgi:hypothetical protein
MIFMGKEYQGLPTVVNSSFGTDQAGLPVSAEQRQTMRPGIT